MKPKRRTANHNLIRRINRALILHQLRTAAPQSRATLAERTGLTRSTVSSLVDELIAANLIHETGVGPSRGGRRGTLLALNPSGGCAIGVEMTETDVLVMLTDFIAQPRWQRGFTLETTDPDVVIGRTEALIAAALRYNTDHDAMRPLGIGLGIVGLVDAAEGVLKKATNLGWENIPFRTRWEERFHLPVYMGNEASIATLGENYFGAAQDYSDFIYLKITRNAIGAGVFVNGALYHGTDGYAGEVGHMVLDFSGPACMCGRNGCWEAVLRDALAPAADVATLVSKAQHEDAEAQRVLARVIEVNAIGVANLTNILNPQMVVLGGTVGQALAPVLPEIRRQVAFHTVFPADPSVELVVSQITSNACALGAVALVLDDILGEPLH